MLGPQVATIDGVMTSVRPAPAVPRENPLQAEAAAVERLRRQIAEMPAKGEVASPELLAEFARAQKSYLDKKIGFEMQRRKLAGSGVNEAPAPSNGPSSTISTIPTGESESKPAAAPVPMSPNRSASRMVLIVGGIAALAALLWFVLTRN
jgi:hypothetical protein